MDRLPKFIKYSTGIISGFFIAAFIIISIIRLNYPYEMEWLEGAMVKHVDVLNSGDQIFVQPSPAFVPLIYAPLYYYIALIPAKIFGVGFFALRLTSLIFALLTILLIFRWVRKESDSFHGLISAGFFAGCWPLSGYFYDLARVDSLFIFLILASYYLAKQNKPSLSLVMSALLGALAFFSKQYALILILPLVIYLFFENKKNAAIYAVSLIVFIVPAIIIYDNITHGWYTYYNFKLISGTYDIIPAKLFRYIFLDLLKPFTFLLFILFYYLYSLKKSGNGREFLFVLIFFSSTLICSGISRIHWGGFDNVLMPVYSSMAILIGPALFAVDKEVKVIKISSLPVNLIIPVLIAGQLLFLIYNPKDALPDSRDKAAGQELIRKISAIKGDVYLPSQSFYAELAGKKSFANSMAIKDVVRGDRRMGARLLRQIDSCFSRHKFDAIMVNREWRFENMDNFYYKKEELFGNNFVFFTKHGLKSRPEDLYLPK